jgi:hypothetical protein
VVERVIRLLHPSAESAAGDAPGDALAERVLAVAAQHMDVLSADNAAQVGADIDAARVPLSLTAGRHL